MELLSITGIVVIVISFIRFIFKFVSHRRDVQITSEKHTMKYLHGQLVVKDEKIEKLLNELEVVKGNLSEQKRLVAILESTDWEVPCPYWVRNKDHEFVHVNNHYINHFKLGGSSSIIGRKSSEVFPPEFSNRFDSSDDQILVHGKDVYIDEYEGALIIKWRQYTGKITLGVAGIVIPSNSLDRDTILKLISYGETKE